MTGRKASLAKLASMMAFPVLGASLLTGCQESPPAATFNAPAAAPGSHPAPPPTAPAAKGQDKDNLADQQKAMQAENSDGGKAPQ